METPPDMSVSKDNLKATDHLYQPLDPSKGEIRVLELHPGQENDRISGTLHVTQVRSQSLYRAGWLNELVTGDEAPSSPATQNATTASYDLDYEAISYCWGESRPKTKILLNGCDFYAQSSAVEVLRNFRSRDESQMFWIDAICINQEDVLEKEDQVSRMGDVYSNARQTRIWLGQAQDGVREAFEFFSKIGQQLMVLLKESLDQAVFDESDLHGFLCSLCRSIGIPDGFEEHHYNIIFGRPWFSRAWVYQEVSLSVLCLGYIGRLCIPWHHVMLVAYWATVQKEYTLSKSTMRSIITKASWPCFLLANHVKEYTMKAPLGGIPLSLLVFITLNLNASDPRDKIFGLLALTRWATKGQPLPKEIQPDYRSSAMACMRNCTRVMIEEDKDLNVLRFNRFITRFDGSRQNESWPSWVPMWQHGREMFGGTLFRGPYRADDNWSFNSDGLKSSEVSNILSLLGFQVAAVEWCKLLEEDCFQSLDSARRTVVSLLETVHTTSISLLINVLLAGAIDGRRITIEENSVQAFATYVAGEVEHAGSPTESRDRIIEDLILKMKSQCRGRVLFRTNDGRLGLGPKVMRPDDVVTILLGGQWPFILRQQGDQYELIGHCYVQGIMDGETVRERRQQGSEPKVFDIC